MARPKTAAPSDDAPLTPRVAPRVGDVAPSADALRVYRAAALSGLLASGLDAVERWQSASARSGAPHTFAEWCADEAEKHARAMARLDP